MSDVRKKIYTRSDQVVAIVCSDLHLSHEAPRNRAEKGANWYKAQAQSIYELHITKKLYPDAPILIAGDIFDKWNSPAELINFALKELPDDIHAIPGQHDLPFHRHRLINKSAYWSLVESGKIENIDPSENYYFKGLNLEVTAFPWNHKIRPYKEEENSPDNSIKLALIHKYIWNDTNKHPGASEEGKTSNLIESLKGYDVAVCGDNHRYFQENYDDLIIYNCGSFMKRTVEQKEYHTRQKSLARSTKNPQIGLVTVKNKILKLVPHAVESNEQWIETDDEEKTTYDFTDLVKSLKSGTTDRIDFKQILTDLANKEDQEVQKIILEAMEES